MNDHTAYNPTIDLGLFKLYNVECETRHLNHRQVWNIKNFTTRRSADQTLTHPPFSIKAKWLYWAALSLWTEVELHNLGPFIGFTGTSAMLSFTCVCCMQIQLLLICMTHYFVHAYRLCQQPICDMLILFFMTSGKFVTQVSWTLTKWYI